MASSLEMFMAGLALAVNTFVILVMFFLGNIMLAPIINRLEQLITGPQAIPMWDMTYIMPAIWAILLIMEIVIIIAFVVVAGRRVTVDDFE